MYKMTANTSSMNTLMPNSTLYGVGGSVTSLIMGYSNATTDDNITTVSPPGGQNTSSSSTSMQNGNGWNLFSDVKHLCCDSITGQIYKSFCDKMMMALFEEWDLYLKSFELDNSSKIILAVLYGIIIFTSLVGNSLVLLTFAFNRHMRSTTNVFIVSLAVSDLLLTLTAAPFDIGLTFTTFWEFGPFSCKMVPYMTSLSVSCSTLTLGCIAFDRFYAIVYPFKVKFFQSPMKAFALLLFVWVLSMVTNLPQAKQHELVPYESRCDTKYICMQPLIRDIPEELLQLWLPFILLFLLPLIIMTILYGIIIHRLWIKRPIGTSVQSADSFQLRIKKKAIKMLLVVVFLFVLCWLPLQCFTIISHKADLPPSKSLREWRQFLQCLAVSSCCYNPAIYTLMNDKFRKNFINVLMCKRVRVYPKSTDSKAEQQQRRQFGRRKVLPRHPTDGVEEPRTRSTAETRL